MSRPADLMRAGWPFVVGALIGLVVVGLGVGALAVNALEDF